MVQLDIRLVESEPDDAVRLRMRRRLAGNVHKIETGVPEVKAHIRTDEMGRLFMAGLYDWLDDLVRRGHELARGA